MKNVIVVFLLFIASSYGAFANESQVNQDSNLVYEGLSANSLQMSDFVQMSSTDDLTTLICGFSGNVTSNGEVVGHWYSSCVHAQPTIIIIMCE